ncbi:TPA: hypothetical protein RUT62_000890 [Escherichia coli]|uniref:DUF6246 family protein n=1 Tax=Escherichia coli TaxID=562 RepID=UPI000D0A4AD0|nr:DUF6246 family protein [Escherichia coli]MBB6821955.1 hypothetical protein [Escherichia coli]MCO0410605.1 DUF6246 family protein [Escherichia coli]UMW12584.1 DUF6246 family protein [Escherichia coli]HAL6144581.1 hypothetical protein [Escherichia coli]HBA4872064.1 hypothetical protein [Escherichia coli]
MIHTRTGQFVVGCGDKRYFFNPCFAAMARIGDDRDLVKMFATIHGSKYPARLPVDEDLRKRVMARCYGEVVQTCIHILKSCTEDEITPLVGDCWFTPSGKLHLKPGLMPLDDVVTLARHCMLHGLIGDGPEEDKVEDREGEYTPTFDVLTFVYSAVAHLGLSENEAWSMTMTGYRAAVRAKAPPEEQKAKGKPFAQLNKDAYDERMNAAKAILKRMENQKDKKAR